MSTFNLDLNGRRAGMIRDIIGAFNGAAPEAAPTDISVDCGAGMSRDFYMWVASGFTEAAARASGAIEPVPATPGARRLEFTSALIAALALPPLDKSVKNPAMMTVKISPDILRSTSPDTSSRAGPSFKPWFVNDFRLQIDGLEAECKQIASVSAVSRKTRISQRASGASRAWENVVASGEFSPIVITLPASASDGFQAWVENSAKGGSIWEKDGSLEYLGPGGGRPYFQLDLRRLGVTRLSRTSRGAVKIEMYCEKISFFAQAAAFGN
ncbi:MAG: hypothetical protein ABSC93_03130 [Bryobacteraceae bacterium]|jgi:hypothetical protein